MLLVDFDSRDKKKFKRYSLGMKQKLGIAVIMADPDILILDEPIISLDEESVEMVKNLTLKLNEEGKLIIISCHDKEKLEFLSDTIFEICEGEIVNTYKVGDKNKKRNKTILLCCIVVSLYLYYCFWPNTMLSIIDIRS